MRNIRGRPFRSSHSPFRDGREDGPQARSWRGKLQGLGQAYRSQGAGDRRSLGIGRAAAIAFAREGADVAIVYLPDEQSDAQEVIALIEADGRKAVALPGDITNESFCKALVAEAAKGLGGLDILVINAGRQQNREDISNVSSGDFDKTLKTNLYALHWIAQAAVPHLVEHRHPPVSFGGT